jgi:hypothetical protein
MPKKHEYGVHGTFLKMNNVKENFGRVPMLPHHDAEQAKKLDKKHHHII